MDESWLAAEEMWRSERGHGLPVEIFCALTLNTAHATKQTGLDQTVPVHWATEGQRHWWAAIKKDPRRTVLPSFRWHLCTVFLNEQVQQTLNFRKKKATKKRPFLCLKYQQSDVCKAFENYTFTLSPQDRENCKWQRSRGSQGC